MGIEPMTTRYLVVALTTKLLGPFPLGFGQDGRLLLARRGRVYVKFIIITTKEWLADSLGAGGA